MDVASSREALPLKIEDWPYVSGRFNDFRSGGGLPYLLIPSRRDMAGIEQGGGLSMTRI
jgi:hypothetical protein